MTAVLNSMENRNCRHHEVLGEHSRDEQQVKTSLYEETLTKIRTGDVSVEAGASAIIKHLKECATGSHQLSWRRRVRHVHHGMRILKTLQDQSFYSKKSEKAQALHKEIAATCQCLGRYFSPQGVLSVVELYARADLLEEAYQEMKREKTPLPSHIAQLLVPLAEAAHDDEGLLFLSELGASLKKLSADAKLKLAQLAIQRFQDDALMQLIDDGCPLQGPDSNSSLFLQAVSANLIKSVKSMLDSRVNTAFKDEAGNTALHRAFFLGNPEMVRLLRPYLDPHIKNAAELTPLQALLHGRGLYADLIQLKEDRVAPFLQQLLERPSGVFQGIFSSSEEVYQGLIRVGGKSLVPLIGDLLEIAFLLNDAEFSNTVFANISAEEFANSSHELATIYPKEAVDRFSLSHMMLTEEHYKIGCQYFDPPKQDPETNPPIERLLDLFDSLNFTNPDQEHYIDAVAFLKDVSEKDRKILSVHEAHRCLRDDLQTFITRIISRQHFYGTPVPNTPGFDEFYSMLTRMVKHIIATLEQKRDALKIERTLREIISASLLCGGRYYSIVLQEYLTICCGQKEERAEETLFKHLAHFRLMCFEAIISKIPNNDAHNYLDAQRNLGTRFGIPGCKQVEGVTDPYSRLHRYDLRIQTEFCEYYTPQSIVTEILDAITYDEKLKACVISLLKTYGAPQWKSEIYRPVLEALPAIEATGEEEKKEALLLSLLATLGIAKGPQQSAKEAVLAGQEYDYQEHFVYDQEGRIRREAILFILEECGVIRSMLGIKHRQTQGHSALCDKLLPVTDCSELSMA